MAQESERERIELVDHDGFFYFEVWKEGSLLRGVLTEVEAKEICDKGNRQGGRFEVRSRGLRIWPPENG